VNLKGEKVQEVLVRGHLIEEKEAKNITEEGAHLGGLSILKVRNKQNECLSNLIYLIDEDSQRTTDRNHKSRSHSPH
jgi:hypothetical protein